MIAVPNAAMHHMPGDMRPRSSIEAIMTPPSRCSVGAVILRYLPRKMRMEPAMDGPRRPPNATSPCAMPSWVRCVATPPSANVMSMETNVPPSSMDAMPCPISWNQTASMLNGYTTYRPYGT